MFDQFPKARTVAVKKEGFIGIMIIYGKHVEVGNGIFISDLREGSNAEEVRYGNGFAKSKLVVKLFNLFFRLALKSETCYWPSTRM